MLGQCCRRWYSIKPTCSESSFYVFNAWASISQRELPSPRWRGPGAVVKAACLESRRSRIRAPLWPSSFKLYSLVKIQHCGDLCDPDVRVRRQTASTRNSKACVCMAVSSHSYYQPQGILLAQFSLYVHKGGIKPHPFHLFIYSKEQHFMIMLASMAQSKIVTKIQNVRQKKKCIQ